MSGEKLMEALARVQPPVEGRIEGCRRAAKRRGIGAVGTKTEFESDMEDATVGNILARDLAVILEAARASLQAPCLGKEGELRTYYVDDEPYETTEDFLTAVSIGARLRGGWRDGERQLVWLTGRNGPWWEAEVPLGIYPAAIAILEGMRFITLPHAGYGQGDRQPATAKHGRIGLLSVQPALDGQIRGGSGPQEAPSRGSLDVGVQPSDDLETARLYLHRIAAFRPSRVDWPQDAQQAQHAADMLENLALEGLRAIGCTDDDLDGLDSRHQREWPFDGVATTPDDAREATKPERAGATKHKDPSPPDSQTSGGG